jgi:hypothetical protein
MVPSTCPGLANDCHSRTCISNVCGMSFVPAHNGCNGGVCDGNGTCVGCLTPQDCAGGVLDHATVTCNGTCGYTCDTGWGDCLPGGNGCETETARDPQNCGGCGFVCPPLPHGFVNCANGACGFAGCEIGWGDCNDDLADGCEVYTDGAHDNCGFCGNVCDSGQLCVGGVCQ